MSCVSYPKEQNKELPPFPNGFDESGFYLVKDMGDGENCYMPIWYWESVLKWAVDVAY